MNASELNFAIEGAEPVQFAAAPMLSFKVGITGPEPDQQIQSVLLQCQIMIDSPWRSYNSEEQGRLVDLFGKPERWGETLRSVLWTHASVMVSPFQGSTTADLKVPCSFDFNLAATKYFAGLESGEVPLLFLFSGSIFYDGDDGQLLVSRISWDREAKFRLPIPVWRKMMDHYYPNMAILSLQRDVFDRLDQFKRDQGIPTWEGTLERLLTYADAATPHALHGTPT